MAMFKAVTQATAGIRRPGAAALDLAYVAAGRLDAFWEFGLSPWDTAAGTLLITEAGGLVSSLQGTEYKQGGNILAGTPKVHAPLLELLAPARSCGTDLRRLPRPSGRPRRKIRDEVYFFAPAGRPGRPEVLSRGLVFAGGGFAAGGRSLRPRAGGSGPESRPWGAGILPRGSGPGFLAGWGCGGGFSGGLDLWGSLLFSNRSSPRRGRNKFTLQGRRSAEGRVAGSPRRQS